MQYDAIQPSALLKMEKSTLTSLKEKFYSKTLLS